MRILSLLKLETPAPSQNHLDFIEALRGLAALYVVAFHLTSLPNPDLDLPFWIEKIIRTGGSGVTLFFVVSAFTLTLSMRLREKDVYAVQQFYIRRIFRIIPLYYVWLIIIWVRNTFFLGNAPTLTMMLLTVSFTFNLVPGYQSGLVAASWTLGVEMLFYLLFPLIYRYANNLQKAFTFFLVALVIASIYTSLLSHYYRMDADQFRSVLQRSFLHYLPVFALGMVVFFVFEKFIQNKSLPRRWGAMLIAAGGFGASALFDGYLKFLLDPLYWQAVIYSLFLLGLSIFPVGVVVNRLTLFWGKLSYSLYLNHPILVLALIPVYRIIYASQLPVELKYAACFLIVLAILTIISYITYRFIEKPGMELGTKIIRTFASKPVVPVPVEAEKLGPK